MQQYIAGIIIFGFGPLLYAALYYFRDMWQYLNDGDADDILIWQVNRQYSHWYVLFVTTQILLIIAIYELRFVLHKWMNY
jgi:hypothetical protein